MTLTITTAHERRTSKNKTSLAIFGPYGVGKTSLLKTLPPEFTLCLDIEAGLKSVQSWEGDSLEIRDFRDFQDIVALIAGPDMTAPAASWYSDSHCRYVTEKYAGTPVLASVEARSVIFVDSITDLTRIAMVYAQQQPDAFSAKTGKPDMRGAYGLLAREVVRSLKHLQQAPGRTIIFVGLLDFEKDEYGPGQWVPQMEGSKAGRELPGIVDQVISMQYFRRDDDGNFDLDPTGQERLLVCRSGNRWALPAKDRSGRLDDLEPPNLTDLLKKINGVKS